MFNFIENILTGIVAILVGAGIMLALITCILVTPVQNRVQELINSPDRIEKPFNIVRL